MVNFQQVIIENLRAKHRVGTHQIKCIKYLPSIRCSAGDWEYYEQHKIPTHKENVSSSPLQVTAFTIHVSSYLYIHLHLSYHLLYRFHNVNRYTQEIQNKVYFLSLHFPPIGERKCSGS